MTVDEVDTLLEAETGRVLPSSAQPRRSNFLYGTGIRVAELVGLDLDDVDFYHRFIRVFGKGRGANRTLQCNCLTHLRIT